MDSGVAYFSAAGNNARKSYESPFNPGQVFEFGHFPSASGSTPFFGGTAHDFSGGEGDVLQRVTIPGNSRLTFSFQWSDPSHSASPDGPGAATDLDIYILNAAGDTILHGGTAKNINADPVEVFGIINTGSAAATINLMIVNHSGPDPDMIKYVLFDGNAGASVVDYQTNSGTIYGHANAQGALAVGAAHHAQPTELQPYSSAGGVPILFDTLGDPISSQVRQKPDVIGPDGVNNTFLGVPGAGDDFPKFFGTSAAVPHVAAVAALMLEANAALTPSVIYDALRSTATPMSASSPDFDSGSGFVNAVAAVETQFSPGIHITKKADVEWAEVGDTITYTYEVTNETGQGPLQNVEVTDDRCEPVEGPVGDDNTNGLLEDGETWEYTCAYEVTEEDGNAGSVVNTATATAMTPADNQVQNSSEEVEVTVRVFHTLTVELAGEGSGSVTGTDIDCPEDCQADYEEGTEVTLTATADSDGSIT